MVELRSQRLRLRPHSHDDLSSLVELIGDWSVMRWLQLPPYPYTEKDGLEWIDRVQKEHASPRPSNFAIADQQFDQFLGSIVLNATGAELAYWIGKPYWGQGYATEAVAAALVYGFGNIELDVMRATTELDNFASERVLAKNGFRRIGIDPKPTSRRRGEIQLVRHERKKEV